MRIAAGIHSVQEEYNMFEPRGIIAAMATPFFEDESINWDELRSQVNRFIDAGIHGLFCLGTNGESFALSFDEKVKIMETVICENRGRLPVYAGTGCITTRETIELTQAAKALGADCASVICPYFAESSQDQLYGHFKAVAEGADIPIVLYNIPARTGVNLTHQTVKRLASIPNIVGIKDSSGNFDNILRYIEETRSIEGKTFRVVSGNDSLILWTLLAGGSGGISGVSNVLPGIMASIYDLWLKGDLEEARRAQDSIRPLRDCMKLGNPNSIIKRAANLRGEKLGPCRAPFNLASEVVDRAILDVLKLYA
jgi:4-hydroxy-tetrahydrodipicolinate synthase